MCSFAARDFNTAILTFITAQAGLILPSPRVVLKQRPFNFDACFTMVTPVEIPERVVEVRS